MVRRTAIAALTAVLGFLAGGPELSETGAMTSAAQAQSLRSIVRQITRPATRKRKRSRRNSRTERAGERSSKRNATPPEAPAANPRRNHAKTATGITAVGSVAAVAAGGATAAAAKPAEPDVKMTGQMPEPPNSWSEAQIVDALKACVQLLAPHDIDAKPVSAIRAGRCGVRAPVLLERIGQGAEAVTFKPALTVNCPMAARLAEWLETEAQPAAVATFGARIKSISGGNGYACRNRNGAKSGRLSEHALANAVDIPMFVLADKTRVSVLSGWGKIVRASRESPEVAVIPKDQNRSERDAWGGQNDDAGVATDLPAFPLRNPVRRGRSVAEARAIISASYKPETPQQPLSSRSATRKPAPELRVVKVQPPADDRKLAFLKQLHTSACKMFGTVLGPEANQAHEDHFHFDLAPRRRSAYCR